MLDMFNIFQLVHRDQADQELGGTTKHFGMDHVAAMMPQARHP